MSFSSGTVIGRIIAVTRVKNAFGNTSFRPSGMFGVVRFVSCRQYQDISLKSEQLRVQQTVFSIPGLASIPYSDTGFAMQFEGWGITVGRVAEDTQAT